MRVRGQTLRYAAEQPLPNTLVVGRLVLVVAGWIALWTGRLPADWSWELFCLLGLATVGVAYAGFRPTSSSTLSGSGCSSASASSGCAGAARTR